jgi:phospholipid transport system substrate-binding protein
MKKKGSGTMTLSRIRGVLVGAIALGLAVPPWIPAAQTKEAQVKEEQAEKKAMVNGNEGVKSLQEALKAKGEEPGPIDGVIGKKTRTALRAFQNANDLKGTGRLDNQTTEKLGVEKRKLLRDAIFPRFDFQEMAKRSLGAEWRSRSFQDQTEFVKLFADFLEKTYVGKIASYSNYTGESIDEPYAEVHSKLLTAKGEEIKINYMLHQVKSEWKVYDLVVGDVSLVKNYSSQFSRVISKSSYEELVRRITQKLEESVGKLGRSD